MINIGNSSIENILVGDTLVDRVYLGTNIVWEHLQSIPYDMEVLYLESTGELFIDTGIIPNNNTGIMATITNTSRNQDRYMIGLRNDTGDTRWAIGSNSGMSNPWYYGYGTYGFLNVSLNLYHGADVYLNYINDGVFRVDEDGVSSSVSLPQLSFTPLYNIRLFGSAGVVDTYTKSACRIHKVKISQGSDIIMDLIPVRKNGVGYMYDKVSGRLFGNNGTGSFIVGQDSYVEIGGIQWSAINIGATNIADYGLYFQWGDSQGFTMDSVKGGQKYCGWSDYKYGDGSTFTKYNNTDGKTVLEASDDAAQVYLGDGWRMPTAAEYAALGLAVDTTWTTVNNVSGMLCTDKTDSSKTLFFPAAGFCLYGGGYNVGSNAGYRSSSLYTSSIDKAYYLAFSDSYLYWRATGNLRNYGFPVRAVRTPNNS